ncbi:PhzF family phenazine biosynthesis protein [Saccharopolyspora rhizosphaerae]|uniref:PhzF family phenazine biosynthesis protein n=1 Tax=Saccharopolyspora rhizosphaerae TaxID=2492662 RepID=A0A426K4J9_9PSEU|nr:PhzF family phenazine biosynthesis protein [Saccharopolyspora rhizosphaerae]RRO20417.1 PhzF family phenazine biosynthesis protein [Saccharopolyspora rhizosphaerae]
MRRFQQVDVFTGTPYYGNPVAVVLDAEGVSDEAMQRFAAWTNLSETTFVLPPTRADADYRVRIFTPSEELPFAGHPTLGTCHAWQSVHGERESVVQECGVGLVEVRRDAGGLAFAAPELVRSGPVEPEVLERVAAAVGLDSGEIVDAQWADNGPGWIALLLADADAVLALEPSFRDDLKIGVAGPHPEGGPARFEVRAFAPLGGGGCVEDPVTGSLNASLAQWLLSSGRTTAPYTTRQGTALGRAGNVRVSTDDTGAVWVGGSTVTCVNGTVTI